MASKPPAQKPPPPKGSRLERFAKLAGFELPSTLDTTKLPPETSREERDALLQKEQQDMTGSGMSWSRYWSPYAPRRHQKGGPEYLIRRLLG